MVQETTEREQNIPLLNTHIDIGNASRSSDNLLVNKKINLFELDKANILYFIKEIKILFEVL